MLNDSIDEQSSIETEAVDLLDWHMLEAFLADYTEEVGEAETDSTESFESCDEGYVCRPEHRHSKPLGGSLDRVAQILSNMNVQDRYTLLAPINQKLLDPKSVFYLKNAAGTEEIAISVEDLLYVIERERDSGEDVQLLIAADDLIDANVPERLADAVRRMSVNTYSGETLYSVIENRSSGYSSGFETRSERVNSVSTTLNTSSATNDLFCPRIPSSPPPSSSSLSGVLKQMHRQSKFLRCSLPRGYRGRVQSVITVPRMLPLAVDDRAAFVLAARAFDRIVDDFIELRSKSQSVEDFLDEHLQNRFVAIELATEYGRLMEALRISTTDELEQRTASATNSETEAAVRSFLDAEERWDEFLKSVDKELNAGMNRMEAEHAVGVQTGDIHLVDCRSQLEGTLKDFVHPVFGRYTLVCFLRFFGCPACLAQIMLLHERRAEFESNLCNIVMVAKGTSTAGSRWLKVAGITFPLLSDVYLEFVQAMQFKRSAYALSNSQLSRKFGQMARAGANLELSTLVDDSKHDIYQLGGHVLIDNSGRVVFAYECSSFDDWPTPDHLLNLISQAVIDDRISRLRSDSRRSRLASDADANQPLVHPSRSSANAELWLPQETYRKRHCTVL